MMRLSRRVKYISRIKRVKMDKMRYVCCWLSMLLDYETKELVDSNVVIGIERCI